MNSPHKQLTKAEVVISSRSNFSDSPHQSTDLVSRSDMITDNKRCQL
jgi:hypothetical protein